MSQLEKFDDVSVDDTFLGEFFMDESAHSSKRKERVNALKFRRKIEELEEMRRLRQELSYDDWKY